MNYKEYKFIKPFSKHSSSNRPEVIMKSALVIIAIFSFSGILTVGNAEEKELTPEGKECLKKTRTELKKIFKIFNQCNKDLGSKNKTPEQFAESIGCVLKCVFEKVGVLDADDKVTAETMKKAIEEKVPEQYRKHVHDMGIGCIEKFGGDNLDPKDANCKSYNTLGTCIQEVYADICLNLPQPL